MSEEDTVDTVTDQITSIQRRAALTETLDELEYLYRRVLALLDDPKPDLAARLRALDYAWSLSVRGDVKQPDKIVQTVVMDHGDHG